MSVKPSSRRIVLFFLFYSIGFFLGSLVYRRFFGHESPNESPMDSLVIAGLGVGGGWFACLMVLLFRRLMAR